VTEQILICSDGSQRAERAVDARPGVGFEDLNRAEALRRAEAGAAHARRAGFAAAARAAIASTTWQGIVDVADELDVAAIVIGSRGVRGFRGFAQGGVSHDVARHARRPLLTVPAVTT
jgi:nucleotide-binding universal stress UspA family protein